MIFRTFRVFSWHENVKNPAPRRPRNGPKIGRPGWARLSLGRIDLTHSRGGGGSASSKKCWLAKKLLTRPWDRVPSGLSGVLKMSCRSRKSDALTTIITYERALHQKRVEKDYLESLAKHTSRCAHVRWRADKPLLSVVATSEAQR